MAPRKPSEAPAQLSTEQRSKLLSDLAIIDGQRNRIIGILRGQVQWFGEFEDCGLVADNRQTIRKAPVWSKLAQLTIACKPSPAALCSLLELCYESIGARSFRGFQAKLKEKLPDLQRDLFHRLDNSDEHGGERLYTGSASIGVRKSGATVMSDDPKEAAEGSRLIPAGSKAWTNKDLEPLYAGDEEDAESFMVDGEVVGGISDDGYGEEDAA